MFGKRYKLPRQRVLERFYQFVVVFGRVAGTDIFVVGQNCCHNSCSGTEDHILILLVG